MTAILIAEDEILVRMVAVEVLRDAGYEVFEAGHGGEALDILLKHSIDLLITDIQMPQMNGYQLVEAVLQRWPETKIVLVTGYARDTVPDAVAKAALHTLQKPFDVDRLPGMVSNLLALS